LNIRPYQAKDLLSVIQVYTASIHALAAPYYSPEQVAAWAPSVPDVARWQERLAQLHTLIADCDGVFAGFISYSEEGYLDFLFTHPMFVRRRVATELCVQVETALRVARLPRVFTHASLAARAFFNRQGFQLDAEECVECRGAYLRRFSMHKDL
jgi:putative acetyltransferase